MTPATTFSLHQLATGWRTVGDISRCARAAGINRRRDENADGWAELPVRKLLELGLAEPAGSGLGGVLFFRLTRSGWQAVKR